MPEEHRRNGHVDVAGFFEAIRTGNQDEVVRNLDAQPWLVDVVNPDRGINERQPLHCAAGHGRLDIVKELVARDAEIHATDGAGNTALDHADAGGRSRIADVLRRSVA